MTATHASSSLGEVLSFEIARLRIERQLSARKLASMCAEEGWPGIDRQRIANIESRRGRDISVSELFGLAWVLRDWPTVLLVGGGSMHGYDPNGVSWDHTEIALSPKVSIVRARLFNWLEVTDFPWDARKELPTDPVKRDTPSDLELGHAMQIIRDIAITHQLRVSFEPLDLPHRG